jgi:hypothetical protein
MSCYEGNDARGKGLARYFLQFIPNLPLRGKLGWMTPRAGVKTTLATKRAFRGSRSQAGAPFSLLLTLPFQHSEQYLHCVIQARGATVGSIYTYPQT